ncbi:uroporphyrinogen-III synthase [Loktanella sp. SALINAS62]|uniref:uroporphyrinogen-III synthase n=1 Tax=Loktanella sp. SALINAS62 TaxID=2706124 RepID=UPI001B8D6764|nr:uroporphyrinogen-III synthase [Loktanella sp. SALINAS62]MBS1302416.1 uroporphyrinogen-III synthase [Loktanella sp. SALINAS62]
MPPVLIISRPAPKGAEFAAAVTAGLGWTPRVILAPAFRVVSTGADVPDADAMIFTSVNGVMLAPAGMGRVAWCVGQATGQAAATRGYAPMVANGDAQALVALILADRPGGRLVHLAGAHRRGAVAETLTHAGLTCDTVVVYRQIALHPPKALLAAAHADAPLVAPLFSPRSAGILNLPDRTAPVYVVAMSDAVAQAAAKFDPTQTLTAAHPSADGMLETTLKLFSAIWPKPGSA